jgi:hypothetical protein
MPVTNAHKKEDQSMADHDPGMLHHTYIAPPACTLCGYE